MLLKKNGFNCLINDMRNFLRIIWYFICKYQLKYIPNKYFINLIGWITHKRFGCSYHWMNINNPKTFNEKINHIKFYKKHKLGQIVADKVLVREYVINTIGEQYLIPLHAIYERASEIEFDKLPNGFALKTNHGSGWNIICTDKSKLNQQQVVKQFDRWLKMNSFYLSREWQYKEIKPKIICEQLLQYEINDYKFFCFNGKPEYIQVDIDRFSNHTRIFFNSVWEIQEFSISYAINKNSIKKPEQLEKMLIIAESLSQGFNFVRVDLYIHNENIYFGEITLHPGGGFEPFIPGSFDRILGDKINLNI